MPATQQKQSNYQMGNNRFCSQTPQNNNSHSNDNKKDWKGSKSTNFQREKSTPRLSDKEKSELLSSISCFKCKKPGHLSRNCPQGNTVQASRSKPPGLANYNIEIEPEGSDDVNILDNLELNMVGWEEPSNLLYSYERAWMEYNPTTCQRKRMGDSLALMSEYVLDIMQPYPGDSEYIRDGIRQRFEVYLRPNTNIYHIYDHLTRQGCGIWAGHLKNPHFHLGEWYACWRARKNKLCEHPKHTWTMGDAYGHNTMLVLRSGISSLYPMFNPNIDNEF